MKTINKFFTVVFTLAVFTFISCDNTTETAEEANPADYPMVTITPNTPSGSTVNEEGSPAFTFTIHMDKLLDHEVKISAVQTGGDASADDFTFSAAKIEPYTHDATFTLSVKEDGIVEDTETLNVKIGAFDLDTMYTINPNSDVVEYTINIENCATCVTCDWRLEMQDAYGDGWNGGYLTFDVGGTQTDYSCTDDADTEIVAVTDQAQLTVSYTSGSWEDENTFQLYDPSGTMVLQGGPNITPGQLYTVFNDCP